MSDVLVPWRACSPSQIVLGPHLKYMGLSLVLGWHYCLWFVPNSFPTRFLLDDRITFSWLIALASAGITTVLMAALLGRQGRLCTRMGVIWAAAGSGCAATVGLTSFGMFLTSPWIAYLCATIVGCCGGGLWMMWGQRLACQRARFTLRRVAPFYGGTLVVLVALASQAPGWLATALVAVMPLASGVLLSAHVRVLPGCMPPLLPAKLTSPGRRALWVVTSISFIAAFVCYYTVAIVPWNALCVIQHSFTWGIVIGGALIIVFAIVEKTVPGVQSTFRVYPWLLLLVLVSCALYLADFSFNAGAFLLAVATSSLFEVLLVMYMGVLTQRGLIPASTAFALSGSAVRLGICCGNGMALVHERVPGLHDAAVRPTMVILVALVAGALVLIVRQEYTITELTKPPAPESELESLSTSVAEEFALSRREREIMVLVGRGYTSAAIAEKLVISPNTVNTHVQHIYRKLDIHKRSELISYLHRRG